jgi:conjugal transfer pilus assembly protein TraE
VNFCAERSERNLPVDAQKYIEDLSQATMLRTFVLGILAVSLGLNVMQAASLMSLSKQNAPRHILTPPVLEKSFWIEGNNLSQEYLEQMGLYVLQLNLNVSPNSVRYFGRKMLEITDPRAHPAITKRIDVTAARLERDAVSTVFSPQDIFVDVKQHPNKIAFSGKLVTLLSDKRIAEFVKTYVIEFGWVGNKTVVVDFRETNDRDPLGVKTPAKPDLEAENNPVSKSVPSSSESVVTSATATVSPPAKDKQP